MIWYGFTARGPTAGHMAPDQSRNNESISQLGAAVGNLAWKPKGRVHMLRCMIIEVVLFCADTPTIFIKER